MANEEPGAQEETEQVDISESQRKEVSQVRCLRLDQLCSEKSKKKRSMYIGVKMLVAGDYSKWKQGNF